MALYNVIVALESSRLPRRGSSSEYPQSMLMSKNKKNRYTPPNLSFTIQKFEHKQSNNLHMRKQSADQHRSNSEADHRLCWRYSDSVIPPLLIPKIICACTDWFVSDMVGNPKDRFSRVAAQMVLSAVAQLHSIVCLH